MIDISEVWNNLGFLLALVVALFLLFMALRVPKKWIRIPAIGFGALFVVIAGLALLLDGYFLLASTARRPGLVSPDGKHVAVVRWDLVGAVGLDHVHVSIRSRFAQLQLRCLQISPTTPPTIQMCVGWIATVY
jgi:hypothetical protein